MPLAVELHDRVGRPLVEPRRQRHARVLPGHPAVVRDRHADPRVARRHQRAVHVREHQVSRVERVGGDRGHLLHARVGRDRPVDQRGGQRERGAGLGHIARAVGGAEDDRVRPVGRAVQGQRVVNVKLPAASTATVRSGPESTCSWSVATPVRSSVTRPET